MSIKKEIAEVKALREHDEKMYEQEKKNPIGKWVVAMVMSPYPTDVGKIIADYEKYWDVEFPHGIRPWDKRYCDIYDTEEEARASYDKFTRNKNNYAYEG
jgi:hypothetical protein